MAVKKSVLYSKLWDSCNTLRSKGGMDATQYKDYVLIILFMKVITDKYYKKKDIIDVPDDANFNTMISLKGKKNIGEEFNKILAKIAEKNELQNIIDVVDFNDENKLGKGKDMVDALTGLVEVFQDPELDFSNNRADDNDVLGDAYEFLMKKFATEAGKSKGQFYTPSEVSRIMAKLLKISDNKKGQIYIYDMACGSGSLLIKAGNEASEGVGVNLYGQEKDTNTAGLCVMNMFLHGNATAQIKVGNTLTNPQFLENRKIRTFDYCVANPPFSVKKWNTDLTSDNNYDRFTGFGTPPDNCGDYAFLLHMLKSMDPVSGRGAIILPHGVLFRGGQEELIRKNLIKSGYIEGVIGLPANLFYGTGIPACIIILDKKESKDRNNIFMINTNKYFVKDGNKNRLREEDIKKITDVYLNRIEVDGYSKIVSIKDIEKEEYNLNIPRYIDNSDDEVIQDIKAHLLGGIPKIDIEKLDKYWNIAPKLRNKLFNNNEKEGYLDLMYDKKAINDEVTNSEEFINYSIELNKKVNLWEQDSKESLYSINSDSNVKEIINNLSENIINVFDEDKLIDKYEAYEFLLEYYNDTLKDDFYLIIENGWIPKLVFAQDKNGKIKKNEFDSDLLPKEIVISEFFNEENNHLEKLVSDLNLLSQEFDSTVIDNTGDEEIFNEDDKVNEKLIKDKIKEESEENNIILSGLLENLTKQKDLKKKIKTHQEALNNLIINKYKVLDQETSKDLIINKKWFVSIERKFDDKYEDLINDLSSKITNEYQNYEETLNQLSDKTSYLESLVLKDLERMGFKC